MIKIKKLKNICNKHADVFFLPYIVLILNIMKK